MSAYYNEIDPYAAQWLRNLIAAGLIALGEVDERSIADVRADDLRGYTQCHFFAGLGGWSYALRLAGWHDDRPVWTGSCPCQPFSVAQVGDQGPQGQSDERHLWPEFFRVIKERKPNTIFGEQVGDAIAWGWWDGVALDLEGEAYACAAQVLRADTFGAVHQRKRLYWVADAGSARREGHQQVACVPVGAATPLPVYGNPLAHARRILATGDNDLLLGDGVSVGVERCATKAYGNAIVPQVAAEFVAAFMECRP